MEIKPINVRSPSHHFLDELETFCEYQLDSCFGDGECMRVCPVVDQELLISELNECTIGNNELTDAVKKFTYDCFQCGQCTLGCPAGVQRDVLMLNLKYKAMKKGEPPHLRSYYKAKGISGWNPNRPESKSLGKEVVIRGYNLMAGRKLGGLKQHVDKTSFKQADTLIYFGCYIFSHTGAQFKTIDIADKLNLNYEVLGGLKSCCGWPQLLGGRIEEAEHLHRYVADIIEQIQPKQIVTGCMECYASLKRMIRITQPDWEPLTTSQWLLQYADQLGLTHSDEAITFHDSCHCTRKLGLGQNPRDLIQKLYHLEELEKNRENALCCGYYNFKGNPQLNQQIVSQKMDMVEKTGAKKLAVECITCQESFEAAGKERGIEVTDLVDLVHRNIFP